MQENDNADLQDNNENSSSEETVEDHLIEENNEGAQGNIGNGIPVFVPDSIPTAIQGKVQVKRLPVRRNRKKKN